MEMRCQYVPLAWYNSGYIGSVHSALDLRSPVATPPPPYAEKEEVPELPIRSRLRNQAIGKQIIYATIRPSLSRLSTIYSVPSTPTSPRSSILLEDERATSSAGSETSSVSEWSAMTGSSSSGFSQRTLRRSRRRARGLSLRDLRAKDSEADLQKVYTATVDEYLNGDIFDNFRIWPEPVIIEET
jgi:hypothetical protein